MGLPIVTYLMNLLHLLGHVLPGASQVLERLDVRSLRHGASDNLKGDGTAGKLRERYMLDDALWNGNNVHIPAATLHHAVPGTRPSFSGRADQPRLVFTRASACPCRVNLLSTCC